MNMAIFYKKNTLLFIIKLSVSLGLIAYLVWLVDWSQSVRVVQQATKFPILVAPIILLVGLAIPAFRWCLLLADNKVYLLYKQAYLNYLVGLFYNIFLPGAIGGDAVRVGRCVSQTKCQIGTATASVLLERLCGIFALMMMGFAVYLFFPFVLSPLLTMSGTVPVMAVAVTGLIGMLVILVGRQIWLAWLPKEHSNWFWKFFYSGFETLNAVRASTLGLSLILSALYQTTDILVTFILARAIGLDVPLVVFFAVIPIVYIATVFPVSLGGLGIREGSMVFLLALFGVSTTDAITLSFLVYFNRIFVGGVGGVVQLIEIISTRNSDQLINKPNVIG